MNSFKPFGFITSCAIMFCFVVAAKWSKCCIFDLEVKHGKPFYCSNFIAKDV